MFVTVDQLNTLYSARSYRGRVNCLFLMYDKEVDSFIARWVLLHRAHVLVLAAGDTV